jgi:Mg2+ and Co2+ transporter CorA
MIRVRVLRDGQEVDIHEVALEDLEIGEQLVDVEEAVLGGDTDVQGRILAIRSDEAQRYLQDVYDHLIRLTESVGDYQEVLAGTLEANATLASNRVNTVARNLAAYAAIFAVVYFARKGWL